MPLHTFPNLPRGGCLCVGSTVCVLRTQPWQRHAAPPPLAALLLPRTQRRVGLRALGVLVLFLGLQEARPAGGFPISDLLPLLMWKALRARLPPTPHEGGRGSAGHAGCFDVQEGERGCRREEPSPSARAPTQVLECRSQSCKFRGETSLTCG